MLSLKGQQRQYIDFLIDLGERFLFRVVAKVINGNNGLNQALEKASGRKFLLVMTQDLKLMHK